MRLLPKATNKPFRLLHRHSRRHIRRRPYIIPIFGLILGAAIVGLIAYSKGGHTYTASDSHVVFVFDSGKKKTVDTKAPTVGELISRLNLHLIPQDVVEPSLDTPIVEDNFRVNIYHARPVTVVDGANKTVALTAHRTARVVAEEAGLKVHAEDIATFSQGEIKNNVIGEQVVVSRATPITLNLYGSQIPAYTLAKTVEGLLKEKNIKLENGEKVNPGLKASITPKMLVFILAKGSHVVTIEEKIPAPTHVVSDASLSLGTTVVRQKGVDGKQVTTYLIITKNGETSRKVIQQAIVQAAVPQITARGITIDVNGDKTKIMAAAGISSGDYGYANFIISHESGWRTTASNPSGAYGLCQALPGSKMSSAGDDWATNPVTQLKWCDGYAQRSYGGWANAYNHWVSNRVW
jgi:uncharacterized protein YabE (DUF348 family)